MQYKCTRKECRILFNLLDSIEFAKNPEGIPIQISSRFRYVRGYNIRHFGRAVEEVLPKLDEKYSREYQEYQNQLQLIQKQFDPGIDEKGNPNKMEDSKIEEMKKQVENLQSTYKETISVLSTAQAETEKKMEQVINVEIRPFKMSFMPDLSNNPNNDAFIFHFQNRGLLIDDVEPEAWNPEIIKDGESQTLGVNGFQSVEGKQFGQG